MRKSISLLVLVIFSSITAQKLGRFWWEKAKGVKITKANFNKIVGKDKYVLLDIYTRNCQYCFKLMPEYNKIFDMFMGPNAKRNDIIIAKLDGEKNGNIPDMYDVTQYPTILLFSPGDTKLPMKYEYQHRSHYIQNYIAANAPVRGKGVSKGDIPKICKKYAKKKVDSAIDLFTKTLEGEGKLLTPKKKTYYDSLEKKLLALADATKPATDDKSSGGNKIHLAENIKLRKELEDLKKQKSESDNTKNLVEIERELRKKMLLESNNNFKTVLSSLKHKIDKIQSTIDTHDLVKPKEEEVKVDPNSQKEDKSKEETKVEEDIFPYSWIAKYLLTFFGGGVAMMMYNRLTVLNNIIKVHKDI